MIADGCSNLGHVVDDDDVYLIIRSIGKPIIILDNRKNLKESKTFHYFIATILKMLKITASKYRSIQKQLYL